MFSYELPPSRAVQALRNGTRPEAAFRNVSTFLARCTTTTAQSPESIRVTVNDHPDRSTRTLREQLESQFGAARVHFDGLYTQYAWDPSVTMLDAVLTFAFTTDVSEPAVRPLVETRLDYFFAFTDPATGAPLPGQDSVPVPRPGGGLRRYPHSLLSVFLARRSTGMPEWLFPFEDQGEFQDYLSSIRDLLPFQKFDLHALRRVHHGANGPYLRRITVPAL
ncbi:hypothetical protein K8F61_14190 [Microbacterium resistens]|uniref:Uncharacterized protein n=1 Tax=Microbacterium resistens TaxID=156977 RepID=A0ABY3RP76_9MICO|nr:hypothetical protein [Microbacterium resistens]UGS25794.1 hypothetical protein K8F61_14190 [Microbacterium resistens]